MANSFPLDRAFAACAHPIRRGILERLAAGDLTVSEATGGFGVSKPAISRHLRVLEEAGAIARVIDGRNHRLRLTQNGLVGARNWINQRALWERKLDVIEEYLANRPASKDAKSECPSAQDVEASPSVQRGTRGGVRRLDQS